MKDKRTLQDILTKEDYAYIKKVRNAFDRMLYDMADRHGLLDNPHAECWFKDNKCDSA